jgi:hypothetical protein
MKLFIAILMLMQIAAVGNAALPADYIKQAIYVEEISIQADENGTYSEETPKLIGELKAIYLVNGNYTGASGVYFLNYSAPGNVSLDSYNLSNVTSTIRAPRIDYNSTYPLFGSLWFNITEGMDWGQATAYIIYG